MQSNIGIRHRGATRPSSLMGARSWVGLAPGRANNFALAKCSEYTAVLTRGLRAWRLR